MPDQTESPATRLAFLDAEIRIGLGAQARIKLVAVVLQANPKHVLLGHRAQINEMLRRVVVAVFDDVRAQLLQRELSEVAGI